MKRIYLDHAATTPVDPRVAKAMRDFELSPRGGSAFGGENYGNPNSQHREGQQARAEIDFARAAIAKFIQSQPQEIIFTSGATEANNLAIQGVVNYALNNSDRKPHVITTQLEHQSVYNLVKSLEKRGLIEATFLKPDKDGMITSGQVQKAIRENTILVSIIFVSNEIGSVLPVREIGQLLHPQPSTLNPLFHIDAVQAAQFYNLNVEKLDCNLLTISAHKIYGPKGIGALYVKKGTKLEHLFEGGSQEYGIRPGTQNTVGIIGFAKAVDLLGTLERRQASGEKIKKLRDKLLGFMQTLSDVVINGPVGDNRVSNNVSVTIFDVDQDALMASLDLAGIAASTGSACVSGSSEPSHVIAALGKIGNRQAATVRFTLGNATKLADVLYTTKLLSQIIERLRHEK